MLEELNSALGVGLPPGELTTVNVMLRAAAIFIVGLLTLRVALTRFTGQETPFDILLGIILGAVLSRAINGSAPFWPTIAGAFVILALHAGLARASILIPGFGRLVKGEARVLIKDGRVDEQALRRHAISARDLEESLRLNAHIMDPSQVREARLERNGCISVIKR